MSRVDIQDFFLSRRLAIEPEDVIAEYNPTALMLQKWWLRFQSREELDQALAASGDAIGCQRLTVLAGSEQEYQAGRIPELEHSLGRFVLLRNLPPEAHAGLVFRIFAAHDLIHPAVTLFEMPGPGGYTNRLYAVLKCRSPEEAQHVVRCTHGRRKTIKAEDPRYEDIERVLYCAVLE